MATPKELVDCSLASIASCVSVQEAPSPESHTVVVVTGLDHEDLPAALARYAVAFLAGWVQRNATIGEHLAVAGVEHRDEIRRLVDRVVVPPEDAIDEQVTNWRQTWRDAWIAELLTHALFVIRRSHASDMLLGDVAALLRPHPLPKRQGLDSVGIYDESSDPVILIGETKASCNRGSDELTNACSMFDDVEAGLYGPDLRDAIDVLADVLPEALASGVSENLWRDRACYVPVVVHESPFNANRHRRRLAQLKPPVERKRVLILKVDGFDAFFDATAAAMPDAVDEVVV